MRGALLTVFATLAALLIPAFAFATTQSSAHYEIQQATLSSGDNSTSSSTSYSSQTSFGEPAVGATSGGNTSTNAGFSPAIPSTSSSGGTTVSSGSSGGTTNGAISPVVTGCSDPAAENYSASAAPGLDNGCRYSPVALAPSTSASSSIVAAIGTTALAAAKTAHASAPQAQSMPTITPVLSLPQTVIPSGGPLPVRVTLSNPLKASALFVLSVVRADGSVATSSVQTVQPGTRLFSSLLSLRGLPASTYTLHVHAIFQGGATRDLNQAFSVAASSRPWYDARALRFFLGVILIGFLIFFAARYLKS